MAGPVKPASGLLGITRWPLLLVLMLAELTSVMEAAMTYAAIPTFFRIYGDPIAIGWLYTAFLLVAGAAAGLCGALGDRLGRRRLLLWTLLIAAAGSVMSMAAPTLGWIVAGRALQGVSLAVLPLTIGLIREHFPEREVPVAIGVLMTMATAAGSLCYILGGALIDFLSWHWIFGVTAAVTLAAALAVQRGCPRSHEVSALAARRIDWLGGTLFAPGVMLVLLALSQAPVSGWTHPWILFAAAAGVAILVGWVAWEWRHPAPLIDIRLMTGRAPAAALIGYAALAIGPFQYGLIVYVLLQEPAWTGSGFGLSATMAGVLNLPGAVAGFIGGPWAGRIARRHGARHALLASLTIYLAGWIGILCLSRDMVGLVGATVVVGLGAPMVFGSIANLLVETTPEDRTSEILGIAEVIRATFMAVGSQLMVVILATASISRADEGSFPAPEAHYLTFVVACLLCLFALSAALVCPRRVKAA